MDIKKYALIDLHLHLDGSLSLMSARSLASKQNIELPLDDGELLNLLQVSEDCRDLNEYLERFELPLSLLQTADAITESVTTLCDELYADGLIYAEIRFAPQLHTRKGLLQEEIVLSAIEGLSKSKMRASLILCTMRGADNRKANFETVDLARKYLGKGVCALDIAGAEALYPNRLFTDLFEYARSLSLPMTIHAGEALGADSVASALELGACRIGHGVRSIESDEVLHSIVESKIPLELCPTSNLNTRVFTDLKDYPIRTLLDAGAVVTLNTDNLAVSNTSLAKEYERIARTFDLSTDELARITLNSARATFLSDEERTALISKIEKRIF